MYHGLTNQFLYSAYRLTVVFANSQGDQKTVNGTCFFVANRHGRMILLTNRHMLDLAYKNSKYMQYTNIIMVQIQGKANAEHGRPEKDQHFLLETFSVHFHPEYVNDIVCIPNPRLYAAVAGGSSVDFHIPYAILAKSADFDEKLQVCDFVAFPGFPSWYDQRGGRPIIRMGTIASDPRYNYSWDLEDRGKCLAYEAFSFGGSSGSPVFAVQKGPRPGQGISFPEFRELMMIGINAGHLPHDAGTHSGISYLYKSSAIVDLIDSV